MLSKQEKDFISYWQYNRLRKKRFRWQLAAGLPLGVCMAIAILVNYLSGWYKRAAMMIRVDPSTILVVIIAMLMIVVFIIIISVYHKWDMNEQHYKELLARDEF
jgi:membrane protein YdbS with pleckstrin-like domain